MLQTQTTKANIAIPEIRDGKGNAMKSENIFTLALARQRYTKGINLVKMLRQQANFNVRDNVDNVSYLVTVP